MKFTIENYSLTDAQELAIMTQRRAAVLNRDSGIGKFRRPNNGHSQVNVITNGVSDFQGYPTAGSSQPRDLRIRTCQRDGKYLDTIRSAEVLPVRVGRIDEA